MTTEEVHRQAVGQLVVAGVEHHPSVVHGVDELGDVVDGERMVEGADGHVATGGERHLAILDVEAGSREVAEATGVVVVQMGEDHVGHRRGVDADGGRARRPAVEATGGGAWRRRARRSRCRRPTSPLGPTTAHTK